MASFGTTSGDRCHHQGRAASGHASCAPIRRHSSWRSLRLLRRSRRPLSSNNLSNLSCLMHVVTCAQGVHDVCAADEKDDELAPATTTSGCWRRRIIALDVLDQQETAGQASGQVESVACATSPYATASVCCRWPPSALGRLPPLAHKSASATSDDQLLVLGGHSASAAGRAIGAVSYTHLRAHET